MGTRLFRVASQRYPDRAVGAVVHARRSRLQWAFAVLAAAGFAVGALLGAPPWVAGAVSATLVGLVSTRVADVYLVVVPRHVHLHRAGSTWSLRESLGAFDRTVSVEQLHRRRLGLFTDSWTIDGLRLSVRRPQSEQLTDLLSPIPHTAGDRDHSIR